VADPVLVAEGVRKTYRTDAGEVRALRGLDLSVGAGELVAVTGPSGSGKTTLLNCLSGIDEVDAGRILLEGHDLAAMTDAQRTDHRARRMGFVFQAYNLIPVLSAVENVELPVLLAGGTPREGRARALEVLDRVGLGARAQHRPSELSGGEQQRVAVARALAGRPAIVWADEPTGNLDSATAATILDLLGEVVAEGVTLVLVTHDAAAAQRATRHVSMADGAVVADDGAPARTRRPAGPAGTGRRRRR
jgi:putative ABC transport system ATP-binding protein